LDKSVQAVARERRNFRRFFLRLADGENVCRVRDEYGRDARVRVKDISLGGARLEMLDGEAGGNGNGRLNRFSTEMELTFHECRVQDWGRHLSRARAYVRWVADERECGCQFYAPLGARRD
jgi:hypothetical protein